MARELLQTAESTKGCESVEAADAIDLLVDALTRGGKARSAEAVELGGPGHLHPREGPRA